MYENCGKGKGSCTEAIAMAFGNAYTLGRIGNGRQNREVACFGRSRNSFARKTLPIQQDAVIAAPTLQARRQA